MKPTTVPIFCGTALAAMITAAVSHWWSIREFAVAIHNGSPIALVSRPSVNPPPEPIAAIASPSSAPTPVVDPSRNQFYESLISKLEALQNQNRDLLDQMAETNRDLMKLEFRVDTHSESFRPLPVNEVIHDTTFDDGPGVLPPRAEPVFLPSNE